MGRFISIVAIILIASFNAAYADQSKAKSKHEIIEFTRQNPIGETKLSIKKIKPFLTKGVIDKSEKLQFYVRDIPDGPGVFNIFWAATYNATNEKSQDIVGVIDPLFAALRLYMVDSHQGAIDAIDEIGVCAMPIEFRPWQLHQKAETLEIESMPIAKDLKTINKAKIPDFTNVLYSIDREFLRQNIKSFSKALAKLNASETGNGAPWYPEENIQCGKIINNVNKPAQTAPIKYQKHDTEFAPQIEIKPEAKKPIIAQASKSAADLIFAHSIGEVPSGNMVWMAESQKSDIGIVKLKQRLVFYDKENNPKWSKWFDETNIRYKLPLAPIMALPNGNLLAIGENKNPNGRKAYSIFSCGSPLSGMSFQTNFELCGQSDLSDLSELKPQIAIAKEAEKKPLFPNINLNFSGINEDKIFANMAPHLSIRWRVNTDLLPDECRKSKGCTTNISKNAYVPLKSMRLTKGEYSHLGTPYAQADMSVANGFLKIVGTEAENPPLVGDAAPPPNYFTQSLSEIMSGGKKTPGNLNDYWAHDYGIDCSAFLQTAWGGGEFSGRTNTAALQNGKFGLACQNRVQNIEKLESGDAIGVRIDGGPNHVVIFANTQVFDGANQSWVVIESASSCDGVCVSVYDPVFFNGWGIYRAKNRSDKNCPDGSSKQNILANPIPSNKASWAKKTKYSDPE